MKVKKKQMVKHSRFVLNSPFLDKTQERIAKTNEKLGFYSKKIMAVLIAISTMATPLIASPAYAKSSDSSSSVGTTSDSSKDVESLTSAEVNDEAGEEPEPYQCSGDYVDYENTELLTDGDGAGEITCAQSNGVYYKLTDGNKASSYHWIAWYRDKSQDEVDVSDDDGNYTGFSSSKVSAWTPYQSEIEELNDGAFPESKSYTYPTDTTTGSLDFWADIAGNYTVLGDPKYDSLELTAYEQVVYARTEEVEEPYEIPSDEDVSADDAGGSAGGSGGSVDGSDYSDTGDGNKASKDDETWTAYKFCNNQARKDFNKILNDLGYSTKNDNEDKNGITAESKLYEDFTTNKEKINKKIKKIIEKFKEETNLDLQTVLSKKFMNEDVKLSKKEEKKLNYATEELKKVFSTDEFNKYYKEKEVLQSYHDVVLQPEFTSYIKNVFKHPISTAKTNIETLNRYGILAYIGLKSPSSDSQTKYIETILSQLVANGVMDKPSTNQDLSSLKNSAPGDLLCKVTKRATYGEYETSDGNKRKTKMIKSHYNDGRTLYTYYIKDDSGKYQKVGNSEKVGGIFESVKDYYGNKKTTNKLITWLQGAKDEDNTDMETFHEDSSATLSESDVNESLSSKNEDNEIIGDPEYEAGEATYSEDSGYTVIKTSTTTYYYMNVEIAKATINNVYATELAQLDNLGIVKGAGNDVQAKISKDSDSFWGSVTPSYWGNEGAITINNDSSTIYHFDTVDSRNGYGYTDDEYTVDLYSLLTNHDKISKFIHGYNNIKDSKASSTNYPKGVEENCITTKSSTGKSSQVCSKAQTPLMKQTLVINENSQDQEELDDEQVETNVTLTKDNDKDDNSSE